MKQPENNLTKLDPVWAIGCMSGTSLDGVDAAAILTNGIDIIEFGQSEFRPYSEPERHVISTALGEWPNSDLSIEAIEVVTKAHIEIVKRFNLFAVIGFHGQTLAHDPNAGRTHQCGDAELLSNKTGQTVVSNFREADMKAGGQGAPLAPFYHFALAKYLQFNTPVLFLNLGGVANITWADPSYSTPEHANALIAFDTGPANGPINDFIFDRLGENYDQDGQLASQGRINESVLSQFLNNSFFANRPPKSLDRNHFQKIIDQLTPLDTPDALATLTAFVAHSVAASLKFLPQVPAQILVCGGGRKNNTMMRMLAMTLPCKIVSIDTFGIDGNMLEAQAFGYLAVRVMHHLPTSSPSTTGCDKLVSGGNVYLNTR